VRESFGAAHVIDVLRGADTANIRTRRHHELTTYGLLKEVPKPDLRDWVYQLIGQGVLVQTDDEYPILKLNAASWEVMGGKRSVRLIRLTRREKASGSTIGPFELPVGADPELFEALKKLRRQEASRMGVQPYIVFPDTVLAEFARGRPTTEEAMRRVSGVGEARLREYGKTFLKAIKDYCRNTGLPTDVPLPKLPALPPARSASSAKPTPKPTARKELAFQMFRAGASIEDVAKKAEVTTSTATEYLAEFIRAEKPESIFDWVPEEVCERVAAAADKHGTARLKPVFLELNGEVSYDQIRVVFACMDVWS
jgi:ATP-dependent DNA helicase RecQ